MNRYDLIVRNGILVMTTGLLMTINGGQISCSTESAGRGGNVRVQAGSILLSSFPGDQFNSDTGIFASSSSIGPGGSVRVRAISLFVDGGAWLH